MNEVFPEKVQIDARLPAIPTGLTPSAWYKGDSLKDLAEGAAVTQWNDESGNGRHLVQATGSLQPVVKHGIINGRSAIRFDETGRLLASNGFTVGSLIAAQAGTIFAVFFIDSDAATDDMIFRGHDAATGTKFIQLLRNGVNLEAYNFDTTSDIAIKAVTIGAWHLATWGHDSTNVIISVDDQDDAARVVSASGATDADILSSTAFSIGAGPSGGAPLKGFIAELILFNSALSEINRRAVSTYLKEKYNLLNDQTTEELVWTELLDIQINPPIQINRGIQGTSQRDRVASTGTMSFQLDNSAENSQKKLGLYSPNNVNALLGWDIGTAVRCTVTYLAIGETVFRGTVVKITPISGKHGDRKVIVSCVDWMEEAATAKVHGIPIQLNKRSDEVFLTILAGVERQPIAILAGIGADTYPFALDNALDEEVSVMTELQKLAQSALEYAFVKRDGTLTWEGRHRRPNLTTLAETLTDQDILSVQADRGREEIINRAEMQAHPRRVDAAATTVLFTHASKPRIERNTSTLINALYRDPAQRATRVGGLNMVTPVATTDYTFNTLEDGTGTDLTSQLVVGAVFGGNSAEVTVTNNGPQDGFLTKLELRGKGVYDFETVLAIADNVLSKAKYGGSLFSLDMPYQHNLNTAKDAADFVVAQSKSLLTPVRGVSFIANREDRLMKAALRLEVSDRVRVEETMVGTDPVAPIGETTLVSALEFFIQAVSLTIGEAGIIVCSWVLQPADPFAYWILEVAGFTELDLTTRLGYGAFVPGWVLGTSVLGTDTRVNS